MKVTIIKEWQTEAVVDAPNGLSNRELRDWLAHKADEVGNDLLNAEWSSTYCTGTDTDEEICDW